MTTALEVALPSTYGEWGTVSVNFVPAELEVARQKINDLTQALNALIGIGISALDYVKAFVPSYLDPVSALVQAVLEELKKLATDFAQLGLYITGDWKLLKYPFPDLLGGFPSYETRMIARLTDKKDPTRPDLSSATQVFGGFFYLTVNTADSTTSLSTLFGFLQSLQRFWNVPSNATSGNLPVPVLKDVKYGNDAANIFNFSLRDFVAFSTTPPQRVLITWTLPNNTQNNLFQALPSLPPKGFIVTVSTLPDGIPLYYDRPRTPSETQSGLDNEQVQPRESGPVVDYRGSNQPGQPVVLFGGADHIEFPEHLYGYNASLDTSGNIKANRTRVYGLRDNVSNTVIPLEQLKQTDAEGKTVHYFQKQFLVTATSAGFQWVNEEYALELYFDDLPLHADVFKDTDNKIYLGSRGRPSTYYVRVASVSDSNLVSESSSVRWRYQFEAGTNDSTPGMPFVLPLEGSTPPNAISTWSQPIPITYLSANTAAYLRAVKTALLVLVLCRPDLRVIDEQELNRSLETLITAKNGTTLLEDVALLRTSLEVFSPLLDVLYADYKKYMRAKNTKPEDFRRELLENIDRAVAEMFLSTGVQPQVEQAVVAGTLNLQNTTWHDIFAESSDTISQLVANSIKAVDLSAIKLGKGETGKSGFTLLGLFEQTYMPFTHSFGESDRYGLASNIFSLGISETATTNILKTPAIIKKRKPHFIENQAGKAEDIPVRYEVPPNEVQDFLAQQPGWLRAFYQKYVDPKTGDIFLPTSSQAYLEDLRKLLTVRGSGDFSPVFYWERSYTLPSFSPRTKNPEEVANIYFCRTLLAEYKNGILLKETALALGAAASAFMRPNQDGQWIALRLLDSLPQIGDALNILVNWIENIEASVQSVADTLISYINFVEARIVSLQQTIAKINGLLQVTLSFAIRIPKCGFLGLISNGTDGLLSDFANATNKPSDSPLSYGAGVAVVFALWPEMAGTAFFQTYLQQLMKPKTGGQGPGTIDATGGTVFGIEDLPPPVTTPSDEPDVL